MKIRSVLSCLAISLGLLVALPGAAHADASDDYEAQVITYTNKYRVKYDRVPLVSRSCVDYYAERHAKWMAVNQTMKHQSMSTILSACHLSRVGENIGYGFSTGQSIVYAWMHSTGHRANILKSSYRQIGVGAYQDTRGRWWVSQVFGRRA
jgi:uncharacterized protein YkwD